MIYKFIQLKELELPFVSLKPPFKRDLAAQKISKSSDDIVPSTTNPTDSTNIFDQSVLNSSNTSYMASQ